MLKWVLTSLVVSCCILVWSAEAYPQPPNVILIQEQLQQLLDQEAKLQAMREKLLSQLEEPQRQAGPPKSSGPIPVVGNIAFGSADVSKPKPSSFSTGKLGTVPGSHPFTEVHLESTGIRILTSKDARANRRFLES